MKRSDFYNNMEKTYYIGILQESVDEAGTIVGHVIKYVTEISYSPKQVRWEAGKPAMKFGSWQHAQDVVYGLMVNGYGAIVVQSLAYEGEDLMKTALFNVEE